MAKFNGYEFYKNKQISICNSIPSLYVNSASSQKITSVFIPANTFSAGDVLSIEYVLKLTGLTTGNLIQYLYWNETDDLTTPIQLMTRTYANTNINAVENRRLSIAVADGSGNGSIMYGVTGALDSDFVVATFAISSGLALNWTNDSYIILAGYSGTGTGVRSQFLKVTN
jgi:hypothetical protein